MEGLPTGHSPTRAPLSRRRKAPADRFQAIRESLLGQIKRLKRTVEEIERELYRLDERGGRLQAPTAAIIDELLIGARREIAVSESALRRMAKNEFDCCMSCGATISLDQLTLFPYSVNCGRCSTDFPLDYADKLHVQHLHLRQSLKALSGLIESVMVSCARGEVLGPDWTATLIVLEDLKRDLPEHFALEELDGHVASAVAVAPHFHRLAAHLLAQHGDFSDRLALLLTAAREARSSVESWAQVQQEFLRLAADLGEHERAESEVIGRAHSEDIGSSG